MAPQGTALSLLDFSAGLEKLKQFLMGVSEWMAESKLKPNQRTRVSSQGAKSSTIIPRA